jgi:hypothetical protein
MQAVYEKFRADYPDFKVSISGKIKGFRNVRYITVFLLQAAPTSVQSGDPPP